MRFQIHFAEWKYWHFFLISPKFVPENPTDNRRTATASTNDDQMTKFCNAHLYRGSYYLFLVQCDLCLIFVVATVVYAISHHIEPCYKETKLSLEKIWFQLIRFVSDEHWRRWHLTINLILSWLGVVKRCSISGHLRNAGVKLVS